MACQHSQQTQDADPMLAHRLRCRPSFKPALVQHLMFDGLRVWQCMPQLTRDIVGLMLSQRRRLWTSIKTTLAQYIVLAGHAGGEYKLKTTQWLLNVEPASPVLASIHSVLVSTSCWRDCMHMDSIHRPKC